MNGEEEELDLEFEDAEGSEDERIPEDPKASTEENGGKEKKAVSSVEYNFMISNRKVMRGICTKKCNNLELTAESLTKLEVQENLDMLKSYRKKLEQFNNQISNKIWTVVTDQAKLEHEVERCQLYDERLLRLIAKLQMKSKEFDRLCEPPIRNSEAASTSHLRLPMVSLPSYGNKEGECLEQFFENFEDIVRKYNLPDYEMFLLLHQHLSGSPLTLMSSLRGSARSYMNAKSMLQHAFASTVQKRFNVVRLLTRLTWSNDRDPYEFVSAVTVAIQQFESAKIKGKHVLQFFIWEAMPMTLQREFINITNKTYPSIEEIAENIFTAVDRSINMVKRSIDGAATDFKEGVHGYAANLKSGEHKMVVKTESGNSGFERGRLKCILCNGEHTLVKCDQYHTPREKTDRLKFLNSCIKCGYGHKTGDCTFKFKNTCSFCNGFHFSYLCLSRKNEEKYRQS